MRKLILLSAIASTVAFASVSAQAAGTRGLMLAANDTPTYTEAVPAPPAPPAPPAVAPAPAPAPVAATTPAATPAPVASTTPAATTPAAKPSKKVAHESNEHKARRIAAKYGVYW